MDLKDFFGQSNLAGENILIVGYGVEGRASADFLLAKKATVSIYDRATEDDFDPAEIEALRQKHVKLFFGSDDENLRQLLQNDFKFAIRGPGVPSDSKVISSIKSKGVAVISATQIFMALCSAKIIGVTGTKGKGTTSTLICEILKRAKKDVHLAGNIGVPALSILPKLKENSIAVLEMSSFQLEGIQKSPHIAVVLMITEDHLDYHHILQNYIDAKAGIVKHQNENDFTVFNVDYPNTFEVASRSKAQKFGVSALNKLQNGCYVDGKNICLTINGDTEHLLKLSEVQLPGPHNLENICAAAMAAYLAGADKNAIAEGIKNFAGLEHRLELVREIDAVRYYNDSFSTNPASTIAAVLSFQNPQILILGGSGKDSDFTNLAKVIASTHTVHTIIGIDPEWQRIKETLDRELAAAGRAGEIKYIENLQNMQWIVEAAAKSAFPGDVVLLSPACASFGMFKNYKDRGWQFKEQVNRL